MVCYSASPSGTPGSFVRGCVYVIACFVTVTWWDTAAGTSVWHVLMKGWEPMFPRVAFAHRKVTLMSCWAMMCRGGWVKENIWLLKGSHTCWPVNHVALGCRRSVSHLSHRGFQKGVCVRIRYFCFLAFNVTAVLSFCLFPALSVVGVLSGGTFQQRSALLFLTDTVKQVFIFGNLGYERDQTVLEVL